MKIRTSIKRPNKYINLKVSTDIIVIPVERKCMLYFSNQNRKYSIIIGRFPSTNLPDIYVNFCYNFGQKRHEIQDYDSEAKNVPLSPIENVAHKFLMIQFFPF